MSRYPLDKETLQEEYEELLIKLALKKYMEDHGEVLAAELERDEKNAAKVVNAAFRRAEWRRTRTRVLRGLGKAVTRAAVVFLVLALSATTAYAVFPEVREAARRMIIRATERYTVITLPRDDVTFIDPELYTMEECSAPTWLPDGYELESHETGSFGVFVVYHNKDGLELSYSQIPDSAHPGVQVDTENARVVKTIKIGNADALFCTKDYSSQTVTQIVWSSGKMMHHITTNDEPEIAIRFAESIKALP